MKSINRYFFLFQLIFLLALGINACKPIEPLSVSKVEGVRLKNFSAQGATMQVSVVIKNPNRLKFRITDNNLDLFINKSEMGKAKMKGNLVIPAKSENSYTFDVEADFSSLALGAIPSLVSMVKTKNIEVKLKGDVKVRTMGIGKKHPFEIVERVNLGNR